jgi:hypothetical protein
MRPFRFSCPKCDKVYTIKRAEHVGRRMRCTGCDAVAVIRAASPVDVLDRSAAGEEFLKQLPTLARAIAAGSQPVPLPERRSGQPRRAMCPDVPAGGLDETFVMQSPFPEGTWVGDSALTAGPARGRESLDVIAEILKELPEIAPTRAEPVAAAATTEPAPAVEAPAPAPAARAEPPIEEIKAPVAEPAPATLRDIDKHPVFDELEGDSMLKAALLAKMLAEAEPLGAGKDGESTTSAARRAAIARKAARPDVVVPGRLLAPMSPVKSGSSASLPMITAGFKAPPAACPAVRNAIPVDDLDDEIEFGDTVAADAMPELTGPKPSRSATSLSPVKPAVLRGDDGAGVGRWAIVAMLLTLAAGGVVAAAGWFLLVADRGAADTAAALLP